jgi:hypothetical protein
VRKLWAAVWMELPVLVAGRRSAQCVFDLITSDGRLVYGEQLPSRLLPRATRVCAWRSMPNTDLVAELARVTAAGRGAAEPARLRGLVFPGRTLVAGLKSRIFFY